MLHYSLTPATNDDGTTCSTTATFSGSNFSVVIYGNYIDTGTAGPGQYGYDYNYYTFWHKSYIDPFLEELKSLPLPLWKGTAPRNIAVMFDLWSPWRACRQLANDEIRPLEFEPRRWFRKVRSVRHHLGHRNFCKMG